MYVSVQQRTDQSVRFSAAHRYAPAGREPLVKKAQSIPWDKIEAKYADLFPSETGNVAKPLQLALGACLIQAIGEIVMKSTVALSNFPISASWLQRRSCLTSGMRKISPAIPSD